MLRLLFRSALAVASVLASAGAPMAQPNLFDVDGTTVNASAALLPLFGSTAEACTLGDTPERYDATAFTTDTDGPHDVGITEPVQILPDTDDTILLVYTGTFTPESACDNFLGIGNETPETGLTIDLTVGDYALVVAGFLGTEDDYTVRVTGPDGSQPVSSETAYDPLVLDLASAPNPLRERTTLTFGVQESTDVHIVALDALGREVATLVDAPFASGRHAVPFEASHLPEGVYLVRLTTADGQEDTLRLTVLR
ncbi:MAG: hypothetical protein Rubg2KO_17530 [Rubricoccaceae bacterium]